MISAMLPSQATIYALMIDASRNLGMILLSLLCAACAFDYCIGVAFATRAARIKHVAFGRRHGRYARLGSSIREHTYLSKVTQAMCNGI